MEDQNGVSVIDTVSGVVWIDANTDGVREDTDSVLAGIAVLLYDDQDQLVASTTTLEDGSYHFTDVEFGSYYIQFDVPPEYGTTAQAQDDTLDSEISNDFLTAVFTLEEGQQLDYLDAGLLLL